MASLDSLRVRKYAAVSKVTRTLDDQSVAIRIAYDAKTGGSTSAPVISIITATSLTLTTSLGATVFTFGSGFGTLALLAAGITSGVGDGGLSGAGFGFSCRIMDALPTTLTTASNLVVSGGLVAKTVNGETVYDALLDTSTTKMIAYRVAMDRNVNSLSAKGGHRVKLVNFSYVFNPSAAEAGAVRIYEFNKVDGTTTLVWAALSVDQGAGATFNFEDAPLTAAEGNEYIVALTDATSVTDDSTNFLQVSFIRE